MTKEPTIVLQGKRVQVELHSIQDALELVNHINASIAMAVANGGFGQWNGIPTTGDMTAIRFGVTMSQAEQEAPRRTT